MSVNLTAATAASQIYVRFVLHKNGTEWILILNFCIHRIRSLNYAWIMTLILANFSRCCVNDIFTFELVC